MPYRRNIGGSSRAAADAWLRTRVTTSARTPRARLLARHCHPYRGLVENRIAARIAGGERVLHLSVHSFTPWWHGERRNGDLGLLYDPARPDEQQLCRAWQGALASGRVSWVVRRNFPYRGTSDGLVVALRRRFAAARYLGNELEFNQGTLAAPGRARRLLADLARTLPA